MKKYIRAAFNKTGLDIVRMRNSNASLSRHLTNVFHAKKIDCVIDVGANTGQYARFLRELGFKGWIVSFEPVKAVFDALAWHAKADSKWICYDFALGDTATQQKINVYASTVFSSFLNASDYSKAVWPSLSQVIPEVVAVVRLDDIFEEVVERTKCASYFLKMDTQGYDRKVFCGARKSLRAINGLQSELSLLPVYDGMPDAYEVLSAFHEMGFFISGMYPVNRDESLAVIEYDCVLVRK